MASTQEMEVQFAQRLASNEMPVRSKALKKLRKYINLRSQKETGGFTGEELLKLWKGLFYCLWMQDKPLLQEQLSNQISTLIHSFHSISGQLLYLESFLETSKREWTGIDRLRMDKFFQLVRFMIRQTFELLKRKNWDTSLVGRFLKLLTAQLLQSDSATPSELQFHILDLYMTELAAVGSTELTAEQNLVFIQPFCRTAAKTRDRVLFGAICSSIFSTIINQAPFAIEDLIKEVKALEDLDSGQASEEDDEEQIKEKRSLELGSKGKQVNGFKSKDEEDDFDHLDDLDTELPCVEDDDDIGPVLQFDYASVADELLGLASQSSTPSYNRQKLYSIIKVLRDLSEGIFPQDENPEDLSTDEDDDMFGKRKKMKRAVAPTEDEEGAPSAKKRKKKKAATLSNDLKQHGCDQADHCTQDETKRKKKRRRNKKKAGHGAGGEDESYQGQTVTVPPESLLLSEEQKQLSPPEETSTLESCSTDSKDQPQSPSVRRKKKREKANDGQNLPTAHPEASSVADTKSETNAPDKEHQNQFKPVSVEAPHKETTTPAQKKKKVLGLNGKPGQRGAQSDANGLSSDDGVTPVHSEDSAQGESTTGLAKTPAKKKNKCLKAVTKKKERIKQKFHDITAGVESPEAVGAEQPQLEPTMTTIKKKKSNKSKKIQEENPVQLSLDESDAVPPSRKPARKKRKVPVTFEYEAEEQEESTETKPGNDVGESSSTPSTKRLQSKATPASDLMADFITFQSNGTVPTPLFCKARGSPRTPLSSKKKCQTPKADSKKVTFGLKSNKTAEFRKTDRSLLVSPDGSSRVPFDPKQKPKFGVLKSPSRPLPNNKTSFSTSKGFAKQRPSAADFF